jgi:dipeptidyl aminopeptidase/acylaminoacyl peptidase
MISPDSREVHALILSQSTAVRSCPSILFSVVVAGVLAASPPVRAAGPALEQILAAPFPSEMLASPGGGKLAWVLNVRGVRNLWVAEPPDYRGRQVTRYDKDDGQAIGGLEWTPDAKTILYVRGSGSNRQGEVPNPTSDPAGAEQVVWRVALDGGGPGEPVKIGLGSGVAVSPRGVGGGGDGLALVHGGKIFWAPLGGPADKPVEMTPLVQSRGTSKQLRWSPDGSRLAFISDRGDHALLGIYDRTAKTLRWVSPSVDHDQDPVWSPDGSRIAFLRMPASSRVTLFHSNLAGPPWSILVADAATGTAKTVWRAREGAGSSFQEMVAANQLLWGAGDRLVFPWEGDGWLHLYSVPAQGGEATLLTPGSFEVENVVLTPDRSEVIFNSNQDDIDRRHLWRVKVAGGPPAAVTKGQGIEWLPAVTSDGKALAWFQAGARRPAEAVIRLGGLGGGEARPLAPGAIPADYPANALVEPEPVIFTAADGMPIHAQLFRPKGIARSARRPALLFFHGGSHRQMLLGWNPISYYYNAYAMNQFLASRGYLVLSVNYRSGTGYGLAFREAPGQGADGGSEFNDVLGAGLWLRARPDVDPTRIGLWGGSYGGFLTALGLARASDLFAAGVDLHGVHDWNVGIRTFVTSYDPLERPDEARLAFESSPMAWLDGWRSPVLVIHGDDDRNVAFIQTVKLVEALRKRGVTVEQLIFPDEIHGFLTWNHWLEAYRAAAEFFDRKLKVKPLDGKTP